jgi:hypothetical protein
VSALILSPYIVFVPCATDPRVVYINITAHRRSVQATGSLWNCSARVFRSFTGDLPLGLKKTCLSKFLYADMLRAKRAILV